MNGISKGQARVLDVIERRYLNGDPVPSFREIASELGISSTRAIVDHLNALEKKGLIERDAGKSRSIKMTNPPKREDVALVCIPVFGSIPAGIPSQESQEVDEVVRADPQWIGRAGQDTVYGLRVVGDSMEGKHILDGDIVILEHGADPASGDVVAALIDGESTLKTFVQKGLTSWLQAENPEYPDLVPTEELLIQGVACGVIRKLK